MLSIAGRRIFCESCVKICKTHNFAAPKPAVCLCSSPLPPDRIPTPFPYCIRLSGGNHCRGGKKLGMYPFRLAASRQATLPLLSLRDIFPRPGEVGPQGDGFSGGGKVSGIAIRRPLGGAGCERSEQTEGVRPPQASSPSQSPTVTALPKGEPLAVPANFISLPRPLPLGEVAVSEAN